ncbi:hypothetical protein [Erwinia psidii]|uniref:hypothetical protein n=1 Tax=Erwinia psidii TaxID=69224 RepID=UPI00226B071D|nr:hypothetical protein [Erwinia psidii]
MKIGKVPLKVRIKVGNDRGYFGETRNTGGGKEENMEGQPTTDPEFTRENQCSIE